MLIIFSTVLPTQCQNFRVSKGGIFNFFNLIIGPTQRYLVYSYRIFKKHRLFKKTVC